MLVFLIWKIKCIHKRSWTKINSIACSLRCLIPKEDMLSAKATCIADKKLWSWTSPSCKLYTKILWRKCAPTASRRHSLPERMVRAIWELADNASTFSFATRSARSSTGTLTSLNATCLRKIWCICPSSRECFFWSWTWSATISLKSLKKTLRSSSSRSWIWILMLLWQPRCIWPHRTLECKQSGRASGRCAC